MSIRTLVEINHDHLEKLRENSERIGYLLWVELGSGGIGDLDRAELKGFGITIKHRRHHSEPCPVESREGEDG